MASYIHLENKTTFFLIYSNMLFLKLQMCQIILTHPVYVCVCTCEYNDCIKINKLN